MRPNFASTTLASLLAAFCVIIGHAASAQHSPSPLVHHDLVVTLDPVNHRLKAHDHIQVPGALVTAPFTISLSADLKVQATSAGLQLVPITASLRGPDSGIDRDDHDAASRVPVNMYRVEGAIAG